MGKRKATATAPEPDDRWTPVARGDIYCSPGCGGVKGYCTKAMYDKALRNAKRVAKELGDGWEVELHENLGWWWKVVLKFGWHNQIVWVDGKPGSYEAYISDANSYPGIRAGTPRGEPKRNARAAVSSLVHALRAKRIVLDEAIHKLRG